LKKRAVGSGEWRGTDGDWQLVPVGGVLRVCES
jgi:hypothetical protein